MGSRILCYMSSQKLWNLHTLGLMPSRPPTEGRLQSVGVSLLLGSSLTRMDFRWANPGKAGGGDLIRNDKGEWLKGYARNVGYSTSVASELWPLRDGLRLCIALKLPVVIIELDAKLIVGHGHQNCIDVIVKLS